jgi:hypothetical protein
MTKGNKIIYGLLGFGVFFIVFVFVTLLHINLRLINDVKNKPEIIKHKDKVIICMKEQLECYQETKMLERSKIIKICKDTDFCEKN